jgi:hypothetical protein
LFCDELKEEKASGKDELMCMNSKLKTSGFSVPSKRFCMLSFVRNPFAILLFVEGNSKYYAIAAAFSPQLDRKLTAKRMKSCLSTLPGSTGALALGTVNTGLFQR